MFHGLDGSFETLEERGHGSASPERRPRSGLASAARTVRWVREGPTQDRDPPANKKEALEDPSVRSGSKGQVIEAVDLALDPFGRLEVGAKQTVEQDGDERRGVEGAHIRPPADDPQGVLEAGDGAISHRQHEIPMRGDVDRHGGEDIGVIAHAKGRDDDDLVLAEELRASRGVLEAIAGRGHAERRDGRLELGVGALEVDPDELVVARPPRDLRK